MNMNTVFGWGWQKQQSERSTRQRRPISYQYTAIDWFATKRLVVFSLSLTDGKYLPFFPPSHRENEAAEEDRGFVTKSDFRALASF